MGGSKTQKPLNNRGFCKHFGSKKRRCSSSSCPAGCCSRSHRRNRSCRRSRTCRSNRAPIDFASYRLWHHPFARRVSKEVPRVQIVFGYFVCTPSIKFTCTSKTQAVLMANAILGLHFMSRTNDTIVYIFEKLPSLNGTAVSSRIIFQTSLFHAGARNADVRERVVRLAAAHERTVGIEGADVDEPAARIAPRSPCIF